MQKEYDFSKGIRPHKMVPLLLELRNQLPRLMHRWDYDQTGTDWVCVFCNERPKKNDGSILHAEDCWGAKAEKILNGN